MPQRLVRFLARDGRTYYGDAILPKGVTDISKARHARIIKGDIFGSYQVTDQVSDIRLLLAPLALEDVRTVRCLGLNYALHAKEVRLRRLPCPPASRIEKANRRAVWIAHPKLSRCVRRYSPPLPCCPSLGLTLCAPTDGPVLTYSSPKPV